MLADLLSLRSKRFSRVGKQPVVNRGGGRGGVTMTSGTGTTRNAKKKPLNLNRSDGKNTLCNRFRKVSTRCTRALLLVLFEADTHGECHCCVVCHYRIRSPGALQSEEENANLCLPHVTTCTSVAENKAFTHFAPCVSPSSAA